MPLLSRLARAFRAGPLAVLAATALVLAGPGARAADALLPGDMSLGDPKAKVVVVEYASVMCPHCARFNNEVFPAFKAKYVDTGKVRYVFREFPTAPVQLAAAGFLVARCAPAERYFAVIDALFKGQAELLQNEDAKTYLLNAGKAGGLDQAQVEACLKDKARIDAYNARVKTALEVGKIEATPTFVIGDTRLEGEQTLADLDKALQPKLAAR